MRGRICYLEKGSVAGEVFKNSQTAHTKNPRSREKSREKANFSEQMAYNNHFYGPEGQRNAFLTFFYVVFGRIIGLCVDFKRFLWTLSILARSRSNFQEC